MSAANFAPPSHPSSQGRSWREWCRYLTIDQWRHIDREYLTVEPTQPPGSFSMEGAGVLVVLALTLMVQRYWGGPAQCEQHLAALGIADHPARPGLYLWLYWAAFKTVGYFIFPWLYLRLVMKKRLRDFGVNWDRDPKVLLLYAVLIVGAIVVAGIAAQSPAFIETYPKYKGAGESWGNLGAWMLAYGLQFASLEFLFRGFVLFGLARHFGALAVFAMIVPYSMIHYAKPWIETIGSMIGGVALGTLALRTRSIFGGVIAHTMVAWSMDLFALSAQGRLQRLLSLIF